jgi:hypothetical protein
MEDDQRRYLNCNLHRKYTTFGRHFTKLSVMKPIVRELYKLMQPGETYVDMCCGKNDFARTLLQEQRNAKNLRVQAYDICPPRYKLNFEERNWLQVDPRNDLPADSTIGLNPPFGINGQTAIKFVKHAMKAWPRLIVIISPIRVLEELERCYPQYEKIRQEECLAEGSSNPREAFYIPSGTNEEAGIENKSFQTIWFIMRRKTER